MGSRRLSVFDEFFSFINNIIDLTLVRKGEINMARIKKYYFISVLCLILPLTALFAQADLDIPDNIGNLVGNTMSMDLLPNNQGTGYFWVVNPTTDYNPDPDPPGPPGDIYAAFQATDLYFGIYSISSVNITLPSGIIGPIPDDEGVNVEVTVYVPNAQPEGTYEGWVIAYQPSLPTVRDSFLLRVNVGQQEDVDIIENNIVGSADANSNLVYLGSFSVINPTDINNPDPDGPSNTNLYGLRFTAQNFIDISNPGYYIPNSCIHVSVAGLLPTPLGDAVIPQLYLGDIANVDLYVSIPPGTRAGTYTGQIQVIDDDGWPSDVIGVELTVNPSYDLDISDNTGNLVGNVLTMHIAPPVAGGSGEGVAYFVLVNPNNAD
ncbi:MAG: hypothetical protein N2166_05725, partial [candidate division WOR-3 bacterium]|nr:hypothetical protein [candidate division WOR-3 bacterium]